ncbi:MAG: polynucleotide adenylyltransferase PcnB [Pseudohongiella sp.]|nr:polynucleotide adenylyltransferase PcnB [Pseudohongiella sp.]
MNQLQALPGIEKATLIARDQHPVSRKQISPNALKVLYKLRDAGFHGFLVGGGVRDLLLDKSPKDFDIATNASPEELKKLFRNARIIGRRFKIIHLQFGREIIEVTTFRAPHDAQNEIRGDASRKGMQGMDSAHSTAGMILRDNVYGNIDEDALRRDFTINALYYTINDFMLLDFSTGMEDMQSKLIRIIGNPEERYKEDPVRMLRALRFCAKLDFTMEENTSRPINQLAHLLESISPARLFDETMKLLTGGHAVKSFALLRQYEPGKYLFAPTLSALESEQGAASKLLDLALQNTDSRLAEGKSVTPAFLFASLLWPVLKIRLKSSQSPDINQHQHFQNAVNAVLMEQIQYTAVPKRFTLAAKEIWELQLRLERRNRRSIESAINHPRFRAAYDFLLLREDSGEDLDGLGQWWTTFQFADSPLRAEMIDALPKPGNQPRRRRRGKPSGASN